MNNYKEIIENELENYFDEILNDKQYEFAKKTAESMKYTTCIGGKRLRAILCLESCRLFSEDYKNALPSACALEMLHSQSLIHDDLPGMDNDDLRRGKPSNHKVYGEAIAILAGDALISLGAQTIIDKTKNVSPDRILDAVREYLVAAGIFGIVGGQTADIETGNSSEEYLNFIQTYKTGALFVASCAMGGIIGGANNEEIKILKDFASSYGICFQMADDILDVTSTTEILGKTAGKDADENKLTYIKKEGLTKAKEKLNSQIIKTCDILKKGNINSEIFNELLLLLEKTALE